MTRHLIRIAAEHAAEIAPCGAEVIFAITKAETPREQAELDRLLREGVIDVAELERRLILLSGDAGKAMGPWQEHEIYRHDAWEKWNGSGRRDHEPNARDLKGQADHVAWYLRRFRPVNLSEWMPLIWMAALHHYGPDWFGKYTTMEDWPAYRARFEEGLAEWKKMKGGE